MKREPIIAGFLSLLIPGMGQIYCGEGNKGAAILAAAIIIGNMNIIFLLIFLTLDPDPAEAWAYWVPRIAHDVMSLWSIVFWFWAVGNAYVLAKKG
jgi:TM2 domain-containing membrane protein YozV